MDEFDHVLMEALNESVPPAMFTTNLAERLVKRRRRRSHLWRLLFVLGLVSAATAAMTVAMVFSDDTDARQGTADGLRGSDTPVASSFDEIKANLDYSSSLAISTSQQGATQVQNTTLKRAVLTGALALSAATPLRADGYQFIVSGYPVANPCRSAVSSSTSLAVGALGDVSAADALETRARTRDDSAGIALRSDKYTAMIIVVK